MDCSQAEALYERNNEIRMDQETRKSVKKKEERRGRSKENSSVFQPQSIYRAIAAANDKYGVESSEGSGDWIAVDPPYIEPLSTSYGVPLGEPLTSYGSSQASR